MSSRYSKLFTLMSIRGILASNAQPMQQPGMPQGMQPGMMQPYHGQNGMQFPRDECAEKALRDNTLIEGVTYVKPDPLAAQIETMEKRQKCVASKIRAQQEFSNKVTKLIQQTNEDAKKDITEVEKKRCVTKLDRANHECFVKNVLNNFYTKPVWKVAVHDNVSELFYENKLVLMIVYENVEYNIHPEEKECYTFFPSSTVAAEENALGHIVNIVGKPATPNKGTTASECRPCTDFLKDGKTLDGSGMKCTNSCDPANLLFTASNFRTKKQSSVKSSGSNTANKNKVDSE